MSRVKYIKPAITRMVAFLIVLLMLLSMVACSGGAEYSINEQNITLEVGDTCELSISAGLNSVKWETSSETVATVNENGLVTAVAGGNATISATITSGKEEFVRFANITVIDDSPEIEMATVPGDVNKPVPIPSAYILDTFSEGVIVDETSKNVFFKNSNGMNTAYFKASDDATHAKKWEITGTAHNMVSNRGFLGFMIKDENGKEQMIGVFREYVALNDEKGWDSSFTTLNDGSYTAFNQASCSFYWGESQNGGKYLNYRLVLENDTLKAYFWNDDERFNEPKLTWTIPLTNAQFGGFAKGSSYQLGITSLSQTAWLRLLGTTVKTDDAVTSE